jgi:hypothetical protein
MDLKANPRRRDFIAAGLGPRDYMHATCQLPEVRQNFTKGEVFIIFRMLKINL